MIKKISSIIEYVGWLLEKQRELQQYCTFRIINIKNEPSNEPLLTIQVINKTATFQCYPSEIVKNDILLDGFSKQDIRTITYYATKYITLPKRKIISHKFIDGIHKIVCKIKKNNQVEEKLITEVVKNKSISDYSSEDAFQIGYFLSTEHSIQEQMYIENIKNKDNNGNL